MPSLRLTAFALSLLVTSFAAVGCDESISCTAIGCGQSTFRLLSDDWQPGDYELEVSYSLSGEAAFRCPFRIEASDGAGEDAGSDGDEPRCTQTLGTSRYIDFSVDAAGTPTIALLDAPPTLQLTLRRAGGLPREKTVTPHYDVEEINGPGCGECRTATEDVEL